MFFRTYRVYTLTKATGPTSGSFTYYLCSLNASQPKQDQDYCNKHWSQGDDYNHSTFADLVLSGLLGLRAQKDGTIIINPLLLKRRTNYFAADNVKYRGKYLSVFFDADGSKYKKGAGLTVLVNGKIAAHAAVLGQQPLKVDPSDF